MTVGVTVGSSVGEVHGRDMESIEVMMTAIFSMGEADKSDLRA